MGLILALPLTPKLWAGASQRATSELPLQLVEAGLREWAGTTALLVARSQHPHQAQGHCKLLRAGSTSSKADLACRRFLSLSFVTAANNSHK